MKILYAASEVAPFAKTGGLGDVAGSLPLALASRCEIRVVTPLYETTSADYRSQMEFVGQTEVALSWRRQYCGVFRLKREGVIFYFIDNEYYFKRKGLYGEFDDAERFAFFSKALVDILPLIDYIPDVIHLNDWQTAMVPVYLKLLYAENPALQGIKTVFTIHSIQYQGWFPDAITEDVLGLPAEYGFCGPLAFHDGINFMKGAIELSDRVTAVSPTYAREICIPDHGLGLEETLTRNQQKLTGIINGIDTELFNPETDPFVFAHYTVDTVENKRKNKRALLKLTGLRAAGEDTPVIGIVSRLVEHKGIDLIESAMDRMMRRNLRLVVVGGGEWRYEQMFRTAAHRYPEKLSVSPFFSVDLASKIYAGADLLLMPSKSEPCGLSQLIAMRYGAVPLVRATGGLRDTVSPYDPETKMGLGFSFGEYSSEALVETLAQALACYRDRQEWALLRERCMRQDFSWRRPAEKFLALYAAMCSEKPVVAEALPI